MMVVRFYVDVFFDNYAPRTRHFSLLTLALLFNGCVSDPQGLMTIDLMPHNDSRINIELSYYDLKD